MHYEITAHGEYLRAVIGDSASLADFEGLYRELQRRCAAEGLNRALVVVKQESEAPSPERLGVFKSMGFVQGFRLALVCATWGLYQACNKAERAANHAAVKMRAFLQEMEAVRWLTGS